MKVRTERLEDGAVIRLVLDAGKGNIVDRECIDALAAAHRGASSEHAVRAILLDHEGPHFSFGASVQEHLPGPVDAMLPELHRLIAQLVNSEVPLFACVRGACLGGGLELALACTRIIAAPDAKLGQPEIQLGVFAPAASVLLPLRVGDGRAAQLLLSGASITGETARDLGVVDEVADEPREAALAFVRSQLLPLSAKALRLAHRALRLRTQEAVARLLPRVERMYLDELMRSADANEGLRAFVEKRRPGWIHR